MSTVPESRPPRAGRAAGVVRPRGSARARGSRAGLDVRVILDAARSLDPGSLTVQAVADRLGVDRKAVHHHVADRDTLLRLVAFDAFSAEFSAVQITAESDWQDACRTYARGFTAAAEATGVLSGHLQADGALVTRFLETTEAVLAALVRSGFDDEMAVRALAMLTNLCLGHARDRTFAVRGRSQLRPQVLREALRDRDPGGFTNLRRVAVTPVDTYSSRQLELTIDIFLNGLKSLGSDPTEQ